MWRLQLTALPSFKLLPSSPLSSPFHYLCLVLIIILSWDFIDCVSMTCPAVCFCSQSRQEITCRKTKADDVYAGLGSSSMSWKHVSLESVSGLDVLSLKHLEPLEDTLQTLKIKDGSVKTIPDLVFARFTNLERLDLSGNVLMTLEPKSFYGLSHLKSLDLSGNRLLNLGTSLSPLTSLELLNLGHNSLQELPEGCFSNLTSLISLYLDGNPLKNLNPRSLTGLHSIRELGLRDCSLTSLQDDLFAGRESLEDLDLGQNRLTSFLSPTAMSHLSNLATLDFDNNEIDKLNKYVFMGLNLQNLDLSYNRIHSIDESAFLNASVKVLDLSYNMVLSLSQTFLKPLSTHINGLSLAGNPMGKVPSMVFSDLQLLNSLNLSSCRLNSLSHEAFQQLPMLKMLDVSHNNLHSLSKDMLDFIDTLHWVNLHQNAWVCDCHIKPLSKWLRNSKSTIKMQCPQSGSLSQMCVDLRCVAPSQLNEKPLTDLKDKDITGCKGDENSDGLPSSIQGAIVASCMGFAVILLIITVYLWKRGKTSHGLKRVCVPSNAESSHVIDEDSKVPPLSNCDRASLNESDHSFVVRHYFDTLVTDPKLMSRTSDSEEPTSPKERDSLYSSQPSLYSNPSAPLGIESTV